MHINDISKKDNPQNAGNKLYKVQPVFDHVRNNCILIEPEREHSYDKQIIPTKDKLQWNSSI